MVHGLDLLMFIWEEACNTIVYILNKFPHKVLKDKTLEEYFIGEKTLGIMLLCFCLSRTFLHSWGENN
jgi:Na+/pantothenate symporter